MCKLNDRRSAPVDVSAFGGRAKTRIDSVDRPGIVEIAVGIYCKPHELLFADLIVLSVRDHVLVAADHSGTGGIE